MESLSTTEWLSVRLRDEALVVADVRWGNRDPDAAYRNYLQGHIPGAVYVGVDEVLAEIGDPRRGRHPLPKPEDLVHKLAARGIGKGKRVVAADEEGGNVAARLWWLLRWIGIEDVTVLDGGLRKWQAEGRPVEQAAAVRLAVEPYDVRLRDELILNANGVRDWQQAGGELLDARIGERFRGELEPIDRRAGHIDGAKNLPFAELMEGNPPRLKAAERLRELFVKQEITSASPVAAYCGSGVTACQLLWALDRAGVTKLKLYPGSWSEWIELHPDAGRLLT